MSEGVPAAGGSTRAEPEAQPTPRPIRLPRFVAVALGTYALLVLAWPLVGRAYDVTFREGANLACAVLGIEGVRFEKNLGHMEGVAALQERNIAVYVESRREGSRVDYWGTTLTSRYFGYVPTAIFLALLAATPLPWKRRLKALGIGGLLLYAFVAARVATLLLYEAQNQPGAASHERWSTIVHHLNGLLNMEPTIYSIVPALIWLAAAIRRDDLPRFLRSG